MAADFAVRLVIRVQVGSDQRGPFPIGDAVERVPTASAREDRERRALALESSDDFDLVRRRLVAGHADEADG
jgi:hypothetical protein